MSVSRSHPPARAHGPRPGCQPKLFLAGWLWFILLGLTVPACRADTVITDDNPWALQQALNRGGVVVFDGDQEIQLTNTLAITTNVVLDGQDFDVILDGGHTTDTTNGVRILQVNPGVTLTLRNVRLQNGYHPEGAAIYNQGTLILSNCILSDNLAQGAPGAAGRSGSSGSNGGNGTAGSHGSLARGGALLNVGSATLHSCRFELNQAVGGDGGDGGNGGNGTWVGGDGGNGGHGALGLGGAIFNSGQISLLACTLENNYAFGGQGGFGGTNGTGAYPGLMGRGGKGAEGSGGGIYNVGTLRMDSCTLAHNFASGGDSRKAGTPSLASLRDGYDGGPGFGGAVCNRGTQTMVNCTFAENQANGGAGGDGGDGRADVLAYGNGGDGGDAWGGGVYSTNACHATNCTFSANGAFGGRLGIGTTTPYQGDNGDPGASRGGNVARHAGTFLLRNSILANPPSGTNVISVTNVFRSTNVFGCTTNYQYDPFGFPIATNVFCLTNITQTTNILSFTNAYIGLNAYGTFVDGGYNLSSDNTPTLSGAGSQRSVDPKLGSLTTNGGPVETIALQVGSPALDRGSPTNFPLVDARGVRRPQGGRCDIGAVEMEAVNLAGVVLYHGSGLAGVTIAAGGYQTTTDELGHYEFVDLPPDYYLVVPSLEGYEFEPPVRSVQVGPIPVTNANFTASGLLAILGRVTSGGAGLAGVTVSSGGITETTDNEGYYVLDGLAAGQYTITVSAGGFAFLPSQSEVSLEETDVNGVNFEGFPLYQISGRVTDQATSAGRANVAIVVTTSNHLAFGGMGGWALTNKTDSQGRYSLTNVPAGQVVVTPVLSGYGFEPREETFLLSQNQTGVDFTAFRAFTVSGRVLWNGGGLAGVVITASGDGLLDTTATSDAQGNYTLAGLAAGSYEITAELEGYLLTPAFANPVTVAANVEGRNFTAVSDARITGQVLRAGVGLSGVSVAAGGRVVTTDANGYYAVTNLAPGSYTVAPYLSRHEFDPPAEDVELEPGGAVEVNFEAIPYCNINGRVTLTNAGLAGVTVTADSVSSVTDSNGYYTLMQVRGGVEVTILPFSATYAFAPASRAVLLLTNLNNMDFVALPRFPIHGRVMEGTNGVPNVPVAAGNLTNRTDAQGFYLLSLPAGAYAVSPVSPGVGFQPPSLSVTLAAPGVSNINFIANPPALGLSLSNAIPWLQVTGLPVRNYVLLYTTNAPASTVWQVLTTNTSRSNGVITLSDITATNAAQRFYRARTL